jgi:hypothetical protein
MIKTLASKQLTGNKIVNYCWSKSSCLVGIADHADSTDYSVCDMDDALMDNRGTGLRWAISTDTKDIYFTAVERFLLLSLRPACCYC